MKDYRLEIKIKNNLLYKAMIENGIDSAQELSRRTGVYPQVIGKYLNLTETAKNTSGAWKVSYLKICDYLKRLPEDLYPKQHIDSALKTNKGSAELDYYEINKFLPSSKDPHEIMMIGKQKDAVKSALSTLPKKIADILEKRFGIGDNNPMTLAEIGKIYGVGAERIRGIESNGIRMLKHPSRATKLKDLL